LFELTSAGCCDFSGSGHFIAVSGDGADSSDYRHWEDNANGGTTPGPVNQFNPDYLSPDMDTNVTSANFVGFFENISNINAPIPGVIGDAWATVKVEVTQSEGCPSIPGSTGCIKYYVRGATPETTGPPGQNLPPEFLQVVESELQDAEGFVNFGLADLYSSVAVVAQDQFAVFDNLLVTGSNLPGGGVDGDFNNDGQWDCADVNALTAAIASASTDLSFDMNGDGVITLADVTDASVGWLAVGGANNPGATNGNPFLAGDADLSGAVDGSDFGIWNSNKFTSVSAWCSGDFNADGAVDGSDFGTWNANKFQSSADGSMVPEPTLMLAWLGLAFLVTARKRG
jgi:hypothetical protein